MHCLHEWILSVINCHDKKNNQKNGTYYTQLLATIRGVSARIAHTRSKIKGQHVSSETEEGHAKSQKGFNLHKNSCVISSDHATRKHDK